MQSFSRGFFEFQESRKEYLGKESVLIDGSFANLVKLVSVQLTFNFFDHIPKNRVFITFAEDKVTFEDTEWRVTSNEEARDEFIEYISSVEVVKSIDLSMYFYLTGRGEPARTLEDEIRSDVAQDISFLLATGKERTDLDYRPMRASMPKDSIYLFHDTIYKSGVSPNRQSVEHKINYFLMMGKKE